MPYSSVSEVPSNVPKAKRKQWLEVWNSAYERAKEDGKDHDAAEASAFAQANAVAGPNAKVEKYSEDQPRDEHGRFGESGAFSAESHKEQARHHLTQAIAQGEKGNKESASAHREAYLMHTQAQKEHEKVDAYQNTYGSGNYDNDKESRLISSAHEASLRANATSATARSKKIGGGGNMRKGVQYTPVAGHDEQCQFCKFYDMNGECVNAAVKADPEVPHNADGGAIVSATGWCNEFVSNIESLANLGQNFTAAARGSFAKFIPFVKMDAQKQEVWGVVTAEIPDKEDEVCDYAKSKPYYEEVIDEMDKATDGENFMPLRAMHQLEAVGKGIGYEFRDHDKEIFFGFKVVDPAAWKKVEERVYTGFSHGGVVVGQKVPDPVFKGCMRYVAKPSEVSLVDNPCLGVAHFTYVSKTGEISLRKNRSVAEQSVNQLAKTLASLQKQVTDLAARPNGALGKEVRTKRVAGEDLPASAFLLVGDPEKTETWNLPVKFSSGEKTKRHIRNALSRIDQVKGHAPEKVEAARKKLHALASQHGIDVKDDAKKLALVRAWIGKTLRTKINRYARTKGDPGHALEFLPGELGKIAIFAKSGQLAKGMYEVSRLAQLVDCVCCLFHQIASEQQWEGDLDSPLPSMLSENCSDLLDTLVAMVAEEGGEERDAIAERLTQLASGAQ